MKILSEGIWNNPWTLEVACCNKECAAKLMLDEADVQPTYDKVAKYEFVCPVCGTTTPLASDLISPRVKLAADKHRKYSSYDDR